MQFNNTQYKLDEIYTLVTRENELELEKTFVEQHTSFSRIDFKELRDVVVKNHSGYANESHDGSSGSLNSTLYNISRNNEEGSIDPEIGKVIDYDILVDGNKSFDLMTETRDKLYVINKQQKDSEESLCKAVLEVITYHNLISRKKLLLDYKNAKQNPINAAHTKHDLVPAVMLYEDSAPFNKLRSLDPNRFLGKLIQKYNVRFFVLKNTEANELVLSEK